MLNEQSKNSVELALTCNGVPHDDLKQLVRDARNGDHAAAQRIVEMYGPQIQMEARTRLGGTGLRQLFDSMDIAQSVFRLFFERDSIADKVVEDPRYLSELFAVMTRHKIIDHWRRQTAEKRDIRRTSSLEHHSEKLESRQSDPSEIAAFRELSETILQKLTADERHLAELRFSGSSWQEIAAKNQETLDGVRVRLSRAVRRASDEAGIAGLF